MLTVATFASLCGLSAKVLRSYDELGLFRPAWVDPRSGYRYYSPAQLPAIRRILGLRELGMGLGEIRAVAQGGDVREALERRRAELERERAEAERRLTVLGIRVDMAATGEPGPDVVVREVAAERVATLDLSLAGGDDEAAFDELEAHVRDLRRRANRPPGALVGDPDDPDRVAGGPPRVMIFVPLTRPIEPTDRIGCRLLPAVRAATIVHRGGYDTLPEAWRALDSWAAGAGLSGDGSRRVLYLQFGADPGLRVPKAYLASRSADFVTELQLPLRA